MNILHRSRSIFTRNVLLNPFSCFSRIPSFSNEWQQQPSNIHIVHSQQAASIIPSYKLKQFQDKKQVKIITNQGSGNQIQQFTSSFYNESSWKKIKDISVNTSIKFSRQVQKSSNFLGIASEVLTKAYKFSRKQKEQKEISINIQSIPQSNYILQLAKSKIQAAEWANSRANEANTAYMLQQAQKLAEKYPGLKLITIKGNDLLNEGLRLMHAVGRGSKNQSTFIALEWKGIPESQQFIGLVGKGVCFDSGGLNLKPTTAIGGMHNDKHGACSVLSAFASIVGMNVKANVVCVLGLVQNFISSDSYRPLDIIKSRKGLTVEIGNTDAEGRLVLADCMNWLQEKYKIKTMIEMSTLTGAIVVALGKNRAGLFSNSPSLVNQIISAGQEIQQLAWHMPIDEYHQELVKSKQADITNSSGKAQGASCQAAAFLKNFVEPGVEWAHIDIAAVADSNSYSTGYGSKLLLHFLKKRVNWQ